MQKIRCSVLAGLVFATGCALAEAELTTSTVFKLEVSLQGANQNVLGTDNVIRKTTLSGNNLVNLAQGRSLGSKPEPNVVLAMTVCGNSTNAPTRIIVYDRSTLSNLVTVASEIDGVDVLSTKPQKGETALLMQFQPVGNSVNGLTGGYLLLITTDRQVPYGDCISSRKGTATGFAFPIETKNGVTITGPLALTKGIIATVGAPIGPLIEPHP